MLLLKADKSALNLPHTCVYTCLFPISWLKKAAPTGHTHAYIHVYSLF
jgi:hypothetical protein